MATLIKRMAIFLVAAIVMLPWGSWAEIYRYVDENGVKHYTDTLEKPPESYGELPGVNADELGEPAPENARDTDGDPGGQDDRSPMMDEKIELSIQQLNEEKKKLDMEYEGLSKRRVELDRERSTLVNRPYDKMLYEQKVQQLNMELGDFEKRRLSFEKKAIELKESAY